MNSFLNPRSWSAALIGMAVAALLIGIALLGLAYGQSLRTDAHFIAHPLVAAALKCGSAGVVLLLLLQVTKRSSQDSRDP
jgi:hypothetical protein